MQLGADWPLALWLLEMNLWRIGRRSMPLPILWRLEVVSWIRDICNLPLAPSEGKMCDLRWPRPGWPALIFLPFPSGGCVWRHSGRHWWPSLRHLPGCGLRRYLGSFPIQMCITSDIIGSRDRRCYTLTFFPELSLSLGGCSPSRIWVRQMSPSLPPRLMIWRLLHERLLRQLLGWTGGCTLPSP